MLPHEAIEAFKKLYAEEYGIDLSLEEASLWAHALFNLYKAVCTSEAGDVATPPIQPLEDNKESDQQHE